ncbi:uncharacterized protein LOC108865137 [Galendromus occidentalis]|uniref:Uncharacterized protein LOC108865137 n=1 Tax=Galendromus occidentalis TaxID=34638 RepID=A0AAJ7L6M7_9ACAR|nr:uncharacterized protein LOC108865137 [Galendromus occidentalis]
MLTETFLTHEPKELIVPKYKGYFSEAKKTEGRPSGGLAIFVGPRFAQSKVMFKSDHIIGVEIGDTTYATAYFSPNTPVAEIILEVHELIMNQSTTSIVMYGDFNCRIDGREQRGVDLSEALGHLNLRLMNDPQEMTYIAHNGRSAIDLIFASDNIAPKVKMITQATVERKHQRITVTIQQSNSLIKTGSKRPSAAIRRISSIELEKALPMMKETEDRSLEDIYKQLHEIIKKSARERIPRTRKNKVWYDKECRELKSQAISKIGTEEYRQLRRRYKTTTNEKRMRYEARIFEDKVQMSRCKPWLMLPKKKPTGVPRIDLCSFEKYYEDFYAATGDTGEPSLDDGHPDQSGEWYNEYITNEEITGRLKRMKRGKAVGPDSVAAEIFKDNTILVPIVSRMFNKILDSGRIPQEWRSAHVKPLYKGKGSPEDISSYRCINLTSHLYKTFTGVLADRVTTQCLPQISENQHGFLPHR